MRSEHRVSDLTAPNWVRPAQAVQLLLLVASAVLLATGSWAGAHLAGAGHVLVATVLVLLAAGSRLRAGFGPTVSLQGAAVAVVALTLLVAGFARPDDVSVTSLALVAAAVLQLVSLVLVRGRAPSWAPGTGWDGPVVGLGAAAVGAGALALSLREAPDVALAALLPAVAGVLTSVAMVSAVAVAPPLTRPGLSRAATGVVLVAAADLVATARHGAAALLADGSDGRDVVTWVVALTGWAVIASAPTATPAGHRIERRWGPPRGPWRLGAPGAAVVVSLVVVGACVAAPSVPRSAGGLAIACLAVALTRGRRTLLEAQRRGRADHRPRTDDLTGLANRRALSEALAGQGHDGTDPGWSGWAGWADEIALLLVDLDRFKDVNEALGHESGDVLLAEVGARLRTALRPTQLLARLGGDEFAVVLPAADADAALRVAAALRESLDEPFRINGNRLHVRASVGVATCHPARGEPTDLLRQADVAMYQAKALGSGVEVYDPVRDAARGDGSARLRRIDELREALERGDLEVHLMPQIDLAGGEVCGVEALARWRHPQDGVLLPDSFLPLAENTGLMRPVAALVLERALAACSTWWRLGFDVPVSVNLRADDLRDPGLPDLIDALLAKHALPPVALQVEITEQALLQDVPATVTLLARWRAAGIAVSIDDFGTGYSSLSYLQRLPVDEVKLDRSFLADVGNPATRTIVRHTVKMVHGLGARMVAEGIEDEATARTAADLGCDVGQGLYFGAAMTPAAFLARLRT